MSFLPVTLEECRAKGFEEADFVLVTGDAYVDHPSFGTAIIGKVLESRGFRVAVLAQPDWRSAEDFRRFGKPRLGFLINGGNVDSMVNHYSSGKRRRSTDAYSPGGRTGTRPDRAVIVYSNRAREAYGGVPIMIGGLEASLRRLAHYDYWEDRIRRSVLLDARADLLFYGMGERSVAEVADALQAGIPVEEITWVRGTCRKTGILPEEEAPLLLPSFETLAAEEKGGGRKTAYCRSFAVQYRNNEPLRGKTLAEPYGEKLWVVQNPPQPPLEREELDQVYRMDYEYAWHPSYDAVGGVPALEEVRFSLMSSRGCFGGCSFCAITFHQGREVRSRSREAIVEEAKKMTGLPEFKGYIHDVGGPTANFRGPSCRKQLKEGVCKNRECLFPEPCGLLETSHREYREVLRDLRALDGVKKVFIRSGIRYDFLLADQEPGFLEELCRHHVSGALKVAPEHISDRVLRLMRKPPGAVFTRFSRAYGEMNRKLGKKQYLIPYFISSHPGSTLEDAAELALFLKKSRFIPDQVQDFYPTPGTLSTCMFYTEMDPFTEKPVYVAKTAEEKKMQRALLHFHKPENREKARKALLKAGRADLIPALLGRSGSKPEGGKDRRPVREGKSRNKSKGNRKEKSRETRR